ncbi:MAG: hypothetical protein OXU19_18305 [bacterium]|nr:hypothetical protein [bacterium]
MKLTVGFCSARNLTVCAFASLAIAACSSSDSAKQMTMDDQEMTPPPEPLAIPATMAVSSLERQYAETDADTLDSMSGTVFGPVTGPLVINYTEDTVALDVLARTYVTSITPDEAGGAVVEFVMEGQTGRIEFTADNIANWDDVTDDVNFYQFGTWELGDGTNPNLSKNYYELAQWFAWPAGDDWDEEFNGFSVYGVSTQSENLPMGTASYAGFMVGDLWNSDDNNPSYRSHRREVWGVLALDADLGNNTISGGVDEIWVKTSRDDGEEWEEWSDTISMEFANGRVVDGRVVASWSGEDTSSTTSDAYSLRGFQGNLLGEFYGPAGEEVAGVINGFREATTTTPDQIIAGIFGGELEAPQELP